MMRGALLVVIGGWALSVAVVVGWFAGLAARTYRPRWWRRLWLRRDLRALAHYRRRIRSYSAAAEMRYRQGAPDVGRELAACAVLLVDCDEQIDRALDELETLRR